MTTPGDQETAARPPSPRGRGRRIAVRAALWSLGVLAVLAVLVVAAVLALDTAPGRRLVARQIAGLDNNGVHLEVGRIDGSIYGRMVLRDVAARDRDGVFATSPAIVLDWHPAALLRRHVMVREFSSDLLRVLRRPLLKPSAGPSRMPTLSYTVQRLAVSTLVLEAPLTGERRAVSIQAFADIAHGRTRLNALAHTRALPGAPAGGDVAVVKLDAEPKANRLQLDAHIAGPKGGVIDRLLKLNAPIVLDVAGRGDWADWRGRAQAAVGAAPVLEARLGAQNGRFTAVGSAQPGRLFPPVARLTSPAVKFDLAASVQGPRIGVQGQLSSAQFTANVAGGVDRDKQLLQNVRVGATLLEPAALNPALKGRDVRLALTLDGPFARPLVNYDFTARSLGYGQVIIEQVAAHGRSTRAADGTVQIPLSLNAAKITGFAPTAPPLTAVVLTGQVVIQRDGKVASDLKLRSTRLAASASLRGSQRTASYSGALQARLDAVAVSQLGLSPVLGGAASLTADFASSRRVPLQVSSLRLTSPQLSITNASAAYDADGRISLAASITSSQYGAAQLAVGGTREAIRARLVAPNPKLPAPVTQLVADLAPLGDGAYRLTASGASPSGPLNLDAVIRTRGGPLTVVLNRAQGGGLTFAGTVARTGSLFTGAITVAGDGLSGSLQLLAVESAQAAALDLRAANASLPIAQPLVIDSGRINVRTVLYPHSPVIEGRVNLKGVQSGGVTLTTASADASYRSGAGRASFAVAGAAGTDFKLSGAANLTPALLRIDAQGEVEGVRLRLASPAEISRQGRVWRLAPATILTPDGRAVVAGAYGEGVSVSAQLQQVNLSLLQAVRPDLGVSGHVSGQADLNMPQAGAPTGRLALQIAKLTRTGATVVSPPIDISVQGELAGAGADARGVIRERGTVIGRAQAHLAMPAAGPFAERLRTGQVSGGLRYQGQADALVTLVGMAGQQLTGPVAIGADISGPLEHPQLRGVLYGRGLDYQNAQFGTHITGVTVDGRFNGTRFELVNLAGSTANDGKVTASGFADLSAANGWPIQLTINLTHAQLAESDRMGARLSGTLKISNTRQTGGQVAGDLALDRARYEVTHTATAQVDELAGVHWKGQRVEVSQPNAAAAGPPSRWRLNVRVRAPNRIQVNGLGLESEWRADLVIRGDTSHPRIIGDVRSVRGTYSFGGRRLTLGDSVIRFDGSEPPNPTLDINASATVNSVTASIGITGTATRPEVAFTSTPPLPEDEVLSQLLFGGSTAQLSAVQALQLAASLNALRGGTGGMGVLGKLGHTTGLQNLRIQQTDTSTGQSVGVGAGRYITSNIYVDVLVDARGATATQIEVALTPVLSLLSQISTFGTTSASVRYTHRY